MKHPLNTQRWITFFQRNRVRRPEPDWQAPIILADRARPALEQSLAEFHLGDGGGPAALIAWDAEAYRQGQPGLERVIDLWFAEEKEHSRLLGGLLQRYGVRPIDGHWSFQLFLLVRRWLGVRFELQSLTLTELSSTAYYRMLRRYGGDPALREVCDLILRDESGHLAFQHARLAAAGAPGRGLARWWWRLQFRACGFAAATVLWSSHGRCLRALGGTAREFFGEVGRLFERFLHRLDVRAARSAAARPPAPVRPIAFGPAALKRFDA